MRGVSTREEFMAAVAKGFMANYLNDPMVLVNRIFEKFNEKNPFTGKEVMNFYA
jgi:hypothetical protein